MRQLILFLTAACLAVNWAVVGSDRTVAQTSSGPISDSTQLRLPASAFPSDYKENGNEAWAVSNAEGSTFSKMHVKTYAAMGMIGAWYQNYTKVLTMNSGDVMYISPVEVAYLGTYYADASAADGAVSDIVSNPQNANPTVCSYGARCMTYDLKLTWRGVPYSGLVRIVEQGNAVAEIRSDIFQGMSSQVSSDTFSTNVNNVSQAFVQAVSSVAPTNTPVPPTATATTVPTNTPTPTPTLAPTATPTSTPIPLSFDILAVRAEKYGSKPDVSLKQAPLKQVKIGARVYLSTYVIVRSAPPGANGTAEFRLTSGAQVLLNRTSQIAISSSESATYRYTTTFKPTKAGVHKFRAVVTINGHAKQKSVSIRIVK